MSSQNKRSVGAADGDPQLIDGQTLAQSFDVGIGSQAAFIANDPVQVASRIEHTNGMKVEPLRFGDGEHCVRALLRERRREPYPLG